MADVELREEINVLQKEVRWLLNEEVHHVLNELEHTLMECSKRFLTEHDPVGGTTGHIKSQKILLSNPSGTGTVRCVLTLHGDNITEADVNFKHKQGNHNSVFKTSIQQTLPWKLQQIQDACNHLQIAAFCISAKTSFHFTSVDEVLLLLDELMACIKNGRSSLTSPRRKSMEELLNNENMHVFQPPVPSSIALSFYVHASKLILAAYHLHYNQQQKIEIVSRQQVECTVKWLNEAIMLFTLALQQCQQLKDKFLALQQHQDQDQAEGVHIG